MNIAGNYAIVIYSEKMFMKGACATCSKTYNNSAAIRTKRCVTGRSHTRKIQQNALASQGSLHV